VRQPLIWIHGNDNVTRARIRFGLDVTSFEIVQNGGLMCLMLDVIYIVTCDSMSIVIIMVREIEERGSEDVRERKRDVSVNKYMEGVQ
jgi:hypothetical protein